jgi:outer membrane protein TolC
MFRRAEVQVGQAQVAVTSERNNIETEKLRLFSGSASTSRRRDYQTPVDEPTLNLDELLTTARRQNPALSAARSRESAANVGVSQARSSFLPTLRFQTGFGGYKPGNRHRVDNKPAAQLRRAAASPAA